MKVEWVMFLSQPEQLVAGLGPAARFLVDAGFQGQNLVAAQRQPLGRHLAGLELGQGVRDVARVRFLCQQRVADRGLVYTGGANRDLNTRRFQQCPADFRRRGKREQPGW